MAEDQRVLEGVVWITSTPVYIWLLLYLLPKDEMQSRPRRNLNSNLKKDQMTLSVLPRVLGDHNRRHNKYGYQNTWLQLIDECGKELERSDQRNLRTH